jgi:4-aminobutyrate aminotransferase-like enzyme
MGVAPAPDAELAKSVGKHLREQGIIIGVGGFHKNVMRFQPPLTISQDQLQEAIEALRNALDTVSA